MRGGGQAGLCAAHLRSARLPSISLAPLSAQVFFAESPLTLLVRGVRAESARSPESARAESSFPFCVARPRFSLRSPRSPASKYIILILEAGGPTGPGRSGGGRAVKESRGEGGGALPAHADLPTVLTIKVVPSHALFPEIAEEFTRMHCDLKSENAPSVPPSVRC